jgi:ABC-type polysaccharide/polyol phosphate export permease
MHAPSTEVRVSKFIRVFHRWTSIGFTLVVVAIFAMLGLGQQPAQWLYYVPLLPLFLLLATGLYMFFLPYAAKARRAKGA